MKKFTSSCLALLAALISTAALAQSKPLGATPRPPASPTPAPGLYVAVIDGLIKVTNPSGTSNFAAGQFGFTPSPQQPPVLVPKTPTLLFTPPMAFSAPTSVSGSGAAPKSNAVDCVVR